MVRCGSKNGHKKMCLKCTTCDDVKISLDTIHKCLKLSNPKTSEV